jgi:chemotaxis protein methyltransferase CheR
MTQEVREFNFNHTDFTKVRSVLYNKTGIKLSDTKDSMVYSRLARRLRALHLSSFSDYLDFLANNDNELEHFVNGLTTNLTSFFRENHHFDVLHDYFKQARGPQRIWCAASSTGEEPYSIAMCAVEAYGTFSPPVEIIASDIDSNVLKEGKAAIYTKEKVRSMSDQRLKQFFYKGKGARSNFVKVVPELSALISFKQLNLTDKEWPQIKGNFDLIFCRNVMIYFDKPTQLTVLTQMVKKLKNEGLYFAGHSESFLNASNLIKPIGKTVYKKVFTNH